MEKLGFEPKITICKIAVLPVKLYPLILLDIFCVSNLYRYIYIERRV